MAMAAVFAHLRDRIERVVVARGGDEVVWTDLERFALSRRIHIE
jgi:hypothetical protein